MKRRLQSNVQNIQLITRTRTSGDERSYLFGKAIYHPDGRCGPRVQGVFQLIVMIRGKLRVTVGNATHDLEPGEAILQHPGVREFYRFSPGEDSEHTWCEVSPDALSKAEKRLLLGTNGVHKAPSSIHLLIEEGLAVPSHQNAELHEAMGALARACLLRFAAHARSLDRREASAPIHPVLEKALDVASIHYARLHSADDLARRVGISTPQLRSLYRQARGESPTAMIWRLKVEHAIQLIRSTGLTLGEIAADCGYANPFHLSRSVKQHTGYSPRDLRREEWQTVKRTAPPKSRASGQRKALM